MLSQELRPFDFSEMAGQKENIRILKAILKDPDNAPKCLIFQGAYGSGKTTASRILARKLNNITDRNFDPAEKSEEVLKINAIMQSLGVDVRLDTSKNT